MSAQAGAIQVQQDKGKGKELGTQSSTTRMRAIVVRWSLLLKIRFGLYVRNPYALGGRPHQSSSLTSTLKGSTHALFISQAYLLLSSSRTENQGTVGSEFPIPPFIRQCDR